jgi:beta-carotene 3-hydroxylase
MTSILEVVFYLAFIIGIFVAMEGVAWLLHRYVMHGFGWYVHEDHHRYTKGRFEKNDLFGLTFSVLSFLLIMLGFFNQVWIALAAGIGIMFYGIGYFLVHDIFFHRRIKIRYRPRSAYMKRVLNAHAVHHQQSTEHDGISFGFLYAGKQYAVEE